MSSTASVSSRTQCGPTVTGSKGRLGFRRRVKITTEEARSLYRPRVQDSKVGNVQMSARVCVVRESTVPQGASDVCESARIGDDA
jgi:hypothetical protein